MNQQKPTERDSEMVTTDQAIPENARPEAPVLYPPDVRRRPKLDIGSDRAVFLTMCEGNPGALSVLMKLAEDPMGLMYILDLDDMGMRGPQIWIAWKDHCQQDLEAFKKACRDRDPAMVATVNASRGTAPGTPKAVTHGASYA